MSARLDRITPYKDGGDIEDRIDEIVQLNGRVHVEMMSGKYAWMRIGDECFWILASKGKLVIRHQETRLGYSKPIVEAI